MHTISSKMRITEIHEHNELYVGKLQRQLLP